MLSLLGENSGRLGGLRSVSNSLRVALKLQANECLADHEDKIIAAANTISTSVYASCGACKKPIIGAGPRDSSWCSKCRSAVSS